MKRIWKEGKTVERCVWRLFLAGFLLGILLPNILWKLKWQQQTIASMYLIRTFAKDEVSGPAYLLEVLRIRGSFFLLAFFCGFSVFGVPLAVVGLVLAGMKIGMLLTLSVLQFGVTGGLAGAGLIFPQYLFYLPVWVYFLRAVYTQSREVWKNRGLFPQKVYRYTGFFVLMALLLLAGVLGETYVNPLVVEMLIKNLKFL